MSPESTSDVYAKATERLRDTLKWFLTSLAAVGALLIAGLSLSNIGEASGGRLVAVMVGFGIALAAVIGAAIACAIVLGVGVNLSIYNLPTKPDVTREISKDTALMKAVGEDGISSLPGQLTGAVENQLQAFKSYQAEPQDEARKSAYRAKNLQVIHLNNVTNTVVRMATYQLVRRRFVTASILVAGLAVVSGIGIFIFAWGANSPDDDVANVPVIVETPTDVEVRLNQGGRGRLQGELGNDCVADVIPAVVLEDPGAGRYRIAVASTDVCSAALVDIGPGEVPSHSL
ncbi:hypothetical protein ABN028_34130 [Actinopolymorpha sp. B17G11]|uniref:hypothetical protein n=1 Tax=Actinopolymorpha sp. B17G11 TaxID=3160861 RepID=UPI0032E4958F